MKFKLEFYQQKADELVDAFKKVKVRGTACDAMKAAADMPCSRFWISSESARRQLLNGLERISPGCYREMLEEIQRRCNGDLSPQNVEQVVAQPAPRFYIRPETARRIIQRELKRRRQCRNKFGLKWRR